VGQAKLPNSNIVAVRAEGEGETGSLTAPEEAFPFWQTVLQSRLL
jgi:hypothetical protein